MMGVDAEAFGPFAEAAEAAGLDAGQIENAANSPWMATRVMKAPASTVAGAVEVWVYNDLMGEWQQMHVIQPGQTLFHNLAPGYYNFGEGLPSQLARTKAIKNVPQNAGIVGPMGDRAIPGDTILIPHLPQIGLPNPATVTPTNPGEVPAGSPPPGGLPGAPPPPIIPDVPIPGLAPPPALPAPPPVPGAPPAPPPPAIPPDLPISALPPIPPGAIPGIIPVGAVPEEKKEPEKFWTPTKVAIGAGVVVAGGALAYYLMKKPKRRRRKRRRTRRRRR